MVLLIPKKAVYAAMLAAVLIAAAALAPIVLILPWLHRQLKRHRRRRHLKAKIRRMKKKMEP